MAYAKRWISEIESESQELIDKIICSPSDNSEECDKRTKRTKKVKLGFPTSTVFEPNETSSGVIEKIAHMKNENGQNTTKVNSEITQYTPVPMTSTMSSPSDKYELEFSSPILKQKSNLYACDLDHDSPVLYNAHSDEHLSPIITNIDKLKRIQDKRIFISKKHNNQSSPDLFQSQATQLIEHNSSPDNFTQNNSVQIDNLEEIDFISSQDCSSIAVVNPSNSTGSSVTDLVNYYHQPNPRKKFYKKGGLLHQLRNVIRLQTSRVSLWHHDIFLNKIDPSNLEYISCIVKKKWKEFGCHVLECCKSTQVTDLFLVCLGNNMNYSMCYDFQQIIKVFPPYKTKLVIYKNKEVEMYYNISKFLTEKDCSTKIEA